MRARRCWGRSVDSLRPWLADRHRSCWTKPLAAQRPLLRPRAGGREVLGAATALTAADPAPSRWPGKAEVTDLLAKHRQDAGKGVTGRWWLKLIGRHLFPVKRENKELCSALFQASRPKLPTAWTAPDGAQGSRQELGQREHDGSIYQVLPARQAELALPTCWSPLVADYLASHSASLPGTREPATARRTSVPDPRLPSQGVRQRTPPDSWSERTRAVGGFLPACPVIVSSAPATHARTHQ